MEYDADKKADIVMDVDVGLRDRGETADLMEPLVIGETSRHRNALTNLALQLAQESAAFRHSLPDSLVASLAELVRAMNCYYSNLIEGHDTHPVDIERALKRDYSADPHKRDLQKEAAAHIGVQKWIDDGGLHGHESTSTSICEIHRRFCEFLPPEMLFVQDPDSGERVPVVPGELRQRAVSVGIHVAISPGAIPRFLGRFESVFGQLGKMDSLISVAAAHHRLLWIHPFIDGNGRVARLLSHAMLLRLLDTGAIWSVARGLARKVEDYKRHLADCDSPRRNDYDGRGNLSEEVLAKFTKFFLETCIDQVQFMKGLIQPDVLRERIIVWAEEEIVRGNLAPKSGNVLKALLYRGNLPRADVAMTVGSTERHARRVVAALSERGVLASNGVREPWRLVFPAALASRWMPGLFPEK
jgi:Fic family protein